MTFRPAQGRLVLSDASLVLHEADVALSNRGLVLAMADLSASMLEEDVVVFA